MSAVLGASLGLSGIHTVSLDPSAGPPQLRAHLPADAQVATGVLAATCAPGACPNRAHLSADAQVATGVLAGTCAPGTCLNPARTFQSTLRLQPVYSLEPARRGRVPTPIPGP